MLSSSFFCIRVRIRIPGGVVTIVQVRTQSSYWFVFRFLTQDNGVNKTEIWLIWSLFWREEF